MIIKIKKVRPDAILPQYQTLHAAATDLCACIDEPIILKHGEFKVIQTGLAIALPVGFEAQIRGRSGNAAKFGVSVLHGVGTIDADYRGELGVILINHGPDDFIINNGDRIAQMIIAVHLTAEWHEVEELDETERSTGGFGSTGK
jgi:dUTP pyrophosphatase